MKVGRRGDGARMVAGLKQSGLVEGKHFLLHVRDMKGSLRDIEGVANQLVSERVDLLFTVTTSVTLAAKKPRATSRSSFMPAATRCASTHQELCQARRSADRSAPAGVRSGT